MWQVSNNCLFTDLLFTPNSCPFGNLSSSACQVKGFQELLYHGKIQNTIHHYEYSLKINGTTLLVNMKETHDLWRII